MCAVVLLYGWHFIQLIKGYRELTNNSKIERSISHLQTLYSVVAGLALTVAILTIIDDELTIPIRSETFPYFFAFLVTLVPFYHGALRHLDFTYIEAPSAETKPGALMADWSFLFIESCLFLAAASLLQRPESFSYVFASIFAFDVIWGVGAYLAFSPKSSKLIPEVKWVIINLITFVILVLVYIYLHSIEGTQKPVDTYRWTTVLTIAIARSIWDYAWCWEYYKPSIEQQSH